MNDTHAEDTRATPCWCVEDDWEKVVCDVFTDNDRGECQICGHRKECHDNP